MGHGYNQRSPRDYRPGHDGRSGGHGRSRGFGGTLSRVPKAVLLIGGAIVLIILLIAVPVIIMLIVGLLGGDPIGRANDAITGINNAIKPITDLVNNIQSIGGGEGGGEGGGN